MENYSKKLLECLNQHDGYLAPGCISESIHPKDISDDNLTVYYFTSETMHSKAVHYNYETYYFMFVFNQKKYYGILEHTCWDTQNNPPDIDVLLYSDICMFLEVSLRRLKFDTTEDKKDFIFDIIRDDITVKNLLDIKNIDIPDFLSK